MTTFPILLAISLLPHGGQQIRVTGGDGAVFAPTQGVTSGSPKPGNIKAGTFGDEEFAIVLVPAKSGGFTVGGHRVHGGAKRPISGSMTKGGVLRATMKSGPGNSRQIPVDGRYHPANDSLLVTSIDRRPVNVELPRFGVRLIKAGPYSGRSLEPSAAWEIVLTRSSGIDYGFSGFVEIGDTRRPIQGTLKGKTGKLLGSAKGVDAIQVDGQYDFGSGQIQVEIRLKGGMEAISAQLEPGRLKAQKLFGLVEKIAGNIPSESEASDYKISGIQTEKSFQVDITMKAPYEGQARVKSEYSSQLTSTLKPGDVIELTTLSSAEKSGTYQPNLSISGFWLVEGDGAEVTEFTKTFAGTASDGKFYASSQATTKFRVLAKGTIKITAVYTGHYWGPAGAWNWNPCTYLYKFGEGPKPKPTE